MFITPVVRTEGFELQAYRNKSFSQSDNLTGPTTFCYRLRIELVERRGCRSSETLSYLLGPKVVLWGLLFALICCVWLIVNQESVLYVPVIQGLLLFAQHI